MATLREWRETAELTVEQLAGAVGVPAGTVAAWEAGRATPETHQVGQLALALGVTPAVVEAALAEARDVAAGEGEADRDTDTQEIMDRS